MISVANTVAMTTLAVHRRSLLLMKPITCHMDFASEQTELIHPLVEAHLVDARAQGE